MIYLVVAAASMIAGIIQTSAGFGAGVFLMLIMPRLFGIVTAPALASAISLGLSFTLARRFRQHAELKLWLFPAAVYLAFSTLAINLIKGMDLDILALAFGIFLIVLAIYFFAFSERIAFQANWMTASLCSLISGFTSGLFGIGGPLMAIYFVSATKTKEAYIGNLQFLFATTSAINMLTRVARGIYTIDLIPITVVGILGITAGKKAGLRILNMLDPQKTKKLVYALVGVSGLITVFQQIFN